MNELILLIREFGFPVFISIYFIFSTEKVIKENTRVLQELVDEMKRARIS